MTNDHAQQVIADLQKTNERQAAELINLAHCNAEQGRLIKCLYAAIEEMAAAGAAIPAGVTESVTVDWKEGLGL